MQDLTIKLYEPDNCMIAIPLAKAPGFTLSIQPNFLIVHNIFDKTMADFIHTSGKVVEMAMMNSLLSLVHREILPEKPGKVAEIREIVFEKPFNQLIPKKFFDLVDSHQELIDDADFINFYLNLFEFRGCLQDFKLRYDPELSEYYLLLKEEARNKANAQPEVVEPLPDPETPPQE